MKMHSLQRSCMLLKCPNFLKKKDGGVLKISVDVEFNEHN